MITSNKFYHSINQANKIILIGLICGIILITIFAHKPKQNKNGTRAKNSRTSRNTGRGI